MIIVLECNRRTELCDRIVSQRHKRNSRQKVFEIKMSSEENPSRVSSTIGNIAVLLSQMILFDYFREKSRRLLEMLLDQREWHTRDKRNRKWQMRNTQQVILQRK